MKWLRWSLRMMLVFILFPAPVAADFDLPDSHAAGEDIVIDLTGQGFESYLIAVTRFPDGGLSQQRANNVPEGMTCRTQRVI